MKYLIDTHSLSKNLLSKAKNRDDIFVLQDILDEYAFVPEEETIIKSANIKILDLEDKHFEAMIIILKEHGKNLDLINLYENNGKGDIAMIAYALGEKLFVDSLFPEEYTLITEDKTLASVAKMYGIPCSNKIS